jgi:hypothetical protein
MANGWSRKLRPTSCVGRSIEPGCCKEIAFDKSARLAPSSMSARCRDCRRERIFARPSLQVAKGQYLLLAKQLQRLWDFG